MSENDLRYFLLKIQQLQELAESLKEIPGRREELAACTNHNQVVKLAKSWVYEIGRRWGDSKGLTNKSSYKNLLSLELTGSEQK